MEKLTVKRQNEVKAELLKEQRYLCAICKNDLRRVESRNICLDHDHKTGIIRGVLCRGCNSAEGKVLHLATRFKKGLTAVSWIKSLVAYWELHRIPQTDYIHSTYKTASEKRALQRKRALAKARRSSG